MLFENGPCFMIMRFWCFSPLFSAFSACSSRKSKFAVFLMALRCLQPLTRQPLVIVTRSTDNNDKSKCSPGHMYPMKRTRYGGQFGGKSSTFLARDIFANGQDNIGARVEMLPYLDEKALASRPETVECRDIRSELEAKSSLT